MADKENQTKKVVKTTTAKPKTEAKTTSKATVTAKPTATPSKTAATAKPATTTAKPATKTAAAKPKAASRSSATIIPAATLTPSSPKKTAAKPEEVKPEVRKTAKPVEEKQPKKTAKPVESANGKGGIAIDAKKLRIIIMSAVAFVLVIAIIIGIIVGTKSCNSNPGDKPIDGGGQTPPPFESDGLPVLMDTAVVDGDKPADKYSSTIVGIDDDDPLADIDGYKYAYPNTTAVGYEATVLGTVERVKPVEEVRDEREYYNLGIEVAADARYPKFGSTMSAVVGNTAEKKNARRQLIGESSYLTATGTWNAGGGGYTWMDANGYLYSGTTAAPVATIGKDGETQRQLYKHAAASGLYGGDVSDDEPRIAKRVTMRPRGYTRGYGVTGLYAPAGEVIKIEMSAADMNSTGGIDIHIGQALYNGKANNIWVDKNQMQRIPHLLNTMKMTKDTSVYNELTDTYTCYVGSFIGGPIYIRNESVKFTATISGGVAYSHFILGHTTKEEYEANASSTVPYFDLEVWTYGVLHSGPKRQAMVNGQLRSYEDIYKAAILWEKVSSVTTTGSNQGIVFLYEPFVAAGAAVAFPGQGSVNCPEGWMKDSLNYNGMVTSGSWGNFHEYHHNFQGYGVGNGGEVTNNGMTLVSYALFTKISAKRGISSFGAQGLGGWNNYTSATWALEDVMKIARENENPSNGNQGLALYATLLHNFGADRYIQAKVAGGGQSYAAYMNAWQRVTHNNMYYYFNDILCGTGISNNADEAYPMFVPVSCVYQTGRSYMYDGEKKYFKTMQPYVIPYGSAFNIDLSKYSAPGGQYAGGSIVIPEGFSYRIKSVTKPETGHGTVEVLDEYNLKYTPDASNKFSGQIIVTLEIVKNDGSFEVDDVDLILEFEQSHETNKLTLERTTYTYTADAMYEDATEAYNAGFAGASNVRESWDHNNPTQNANTDIWFYPDTEEYRTKYPNAPESHFFHDNTIEVIDGKLYIEDFGKYRVYLRGRTNAALYYSVDGGENYALGARINDSNTSAGFRPNDSNTYFDVEFRSDEIKGTVEVYVNEQLVNANYTEDVKWIYIREVLIVSSASRSFIGVGINEWTVPQFTQGIRYYRDEACTELVPTAEYEQMTDEQKAALYSKTYYLNNAGQEVSEEDVINSTMTPPKSANYVNAYRSNYEFPDNASWESDYFYIRNYNYNYVADTSTEYYSWDEGTSIVESTARGETAPYPVEKILENSTTTYLHTAKNGGNNVYITLDMGKKIAANSVTFFGRTDKGTTNTQQGYPKQFTVEVSDDGENFTSAGSYTNNTGSGVYEVSVNLNKSYNFRYVKINFINNHSNTGRLILSGIKFSHTLRLTGNGANNISCDNANIVFTDANGGTGSWTTDNVLSCFGHVYVGNRGDIVRFSFNGTRLAILTSVYYDDNFDVYIDGKKVESIETAALKEAFGITYLTDRLAEGKHSVEIRCTGRTAFDSFAIYSETD